MTNHSHCGPGHALELRARRLPAPPEGALSVFFLTVLLGIFLCGCVKETSARDEAKNPVPGFMEMGTDLIKAAPFPAGNKARPVAWNLSPDAQHMYAYLLLSEALAADNPDLLYEALKDLLKYEPTLAMFQDGVGALLSKGRFKEAKELALQGLDAFPDSLPLVMMLSIAYSDSNETEKAVVLLEQAHEKHPASVDILQELMRLYLNQGRTEEAEALFLKIPAKEFNPRQRFLRAHLLSNSGKAAEAKSELREIVAREPGFLEAWLELGLIAERGGDLTGAAEAYSKAAEISPDNLDIWFRLVVMLVDAQKPDEAMAAVSQAPAGSDFLLQASYFFIEAGFLSQAADLLQEAENRGAHPDEVLLYRAVMVYKEKDDPDAATALLEGVPPHSPFYQKALLRRTQILLDAGRFEEARTTAEFARGAYPDDPEFWSLESYSLARLNRLDEAEKILRESLAALPGNEELLYSLGGLMEEAGRRQEAMAVMEELLRTNPNNYKAMNYVGYTLADENRELVRALELIEDALKLSPNADYITDSLAWVQYRLGLFEKAWESINRCLALGGNDPTIWEHYGDIALALGKKDEARKGYKEALKRNPPNGEQIQKKLDAL